MRGIDTGRGRFEQVTKTKLEIMESMDSDELAERVLAASQTHVRSVKAGDGSVFVILIEQSASICSGERSEGSL